MRSRRSESQWGRGFSRGRAPHSKRTLPRSQWSTMTASTWQCATLLLRTCASLSGRQHHPRRHQESAPHDSTPQKCPKQKQTGGTTGSGGGHDNAQIFLMNVCCAVGGPRGPESAAHWDTAAMWAGRQADSPAGTEAYRTACEQRCGQAPARSSAEGGKKKSSGCPDLWGRKTGPNRRPTNEIWPLTASGWWLADSGWPVTATTGRSPAARGVGIP